LFLVPCSLFIGVEFVNSNTNINANINISANVNANTNTNTNVSSNHDAKREVISILSESPGLIIASGVFPSFVCKWVRRVNRRRPTHIDIGFVCFVFVFVCVCVCVCDKMDNGYLKRRGWEKGQNGSNEKNMGATKTMLSVSKSNIRTTQIRSKSSTKHRTLLLAIKRELLSLKARRKNDSNGNEKESQPSVANNCSRRGHIVFSPNLVVMDGRFQVLQQLGRGTFSRVFEAIDQKPHCKYPVSSEVNFSHIPSHEHPKYKHQNKRAIKVIRKDTISKEIFF
ncbi:hypothetical protein RFI_20062, partial [Reticulomyxa filosa]